MELFSGSIRILVSLEVYRAMDVAIGIVRIERK